MARLVLINGPPGVGKSTLAARYVSDHPLALLLDIDSLRCSMGQWEKDDDSKQLARRLATEMARVHLSSGYDVIVPQLVARLDFIEVLDGVARAAGAAFHEILIRATVEDTLQRFRGRRAALAAAKAVHPQQTTEHDMDSIAAICRQLDTIAASRPNTSVIQTQAGAVTEAYGALRTQLQDL